MDAWPGGREFLEHQRLLADHEGYLQGLRMLPFGALFLFEAASEAGWLRSGGYLDLSLIALALVLFLGIQAAYWRVHGRSQLAESGGSGVYRELGLMFLAALVASGAMAADLYAPSSISLTGWAIAGMVLIFWAWWGAFRRHYAVAALAIFAASFAPLMGLAEPTMFAGGPLMYAVFGLLLIGGGILDHLMLLRMRAAARLEV